MATLSRGGSGSDRPGDGGDPDSRTALVVSLGAVLLVALALRAWRLQEVPAVTDESAEVMFAWDIAFAGARPLTHTDAYNGPLWPYLMAGALRVAGPGVELPRRFTLAFGVGAVLATWALAAFAVGRGATAVAGTVAGLVMGANATHALVGSRVAWSNSTTPFWTALATLALLHAVRSPARAWRWGGAGVLAGLALNTHPSVAVYLAGLCLCGSRQPERPRLTLR
jgi:4-amino-4-deoxy-L-arabinose transferase-like glycosyltransferase